MNYEERYPTLKFDVFILPNTNHQKKESNFFSEAYKSGDRTRRYSEYYSENSHFIQKGIVAKVHIENQTRR
jgi:hypothetical protein